MKFILGRKLGMSQIYNEKGEVVPVTVVNVDKNTVTQVKNKDKDGYEAVQVQMGSKKKEFKSLKVSEKDLKKGDEVDVTIFEIGDLVKITGISKGKGFAGGMKRHGFHGAPASHGHKSVKRHVGSIGGRFPQHVMKGLRMPGRMGGAKATSRGLRIASIDKENNLIAVKGAVPGNKGGVIIIQTQ
jgi:large subunit ribosomal protein L3